MPEIMSEYMPERMSGTMPELIPYPGDMSKAMSGYCVRAGIIRRKHLSLSLSVCLSLPPLHTYTDIMSISTYFEAGTGHLQHSVRASAGSPCYGAAWVWAMYVCKLSNSFHIGDTYMHTRMHPHTNIHIIIHERMHKCIHGCIHTNLVWPILFDVLT